MATSADVRSKLAVFLQKKGSTVARSTLFKAMPFFDFLFAQNGDKEATEGIGRPRTGVVVSGIETAKARSERILAERFYYPLIQTNRAAVDDGDEKFMDDYDNAPSVNDWEDNSPLSRFTQPRFKFVRRWRAYKVPHMETETAMAGSGSVESQAAKAIVSAYQAEIKHKRSVLCDSCNKQLWGVHPTYTSGTPTTDSKNCWDAFFSLSATIDDSNIYAGTDRSDTANAFWQGKKVTTTTAAVFEDIIDQCNYDFGFADVGVGLKLILVGPTLFKIAKREAVSKGWFPITQGVPQQYEAVLSRQEVVCFHQGGRAVYVCYDPTCPDVNRGAASNHMACINPDVWTVALHPKENFAISTPHDQTEREGGDDADAGQIRLRAMVACEVPSVNAYFTDVQ